jgi:hypothetical protein
MMRKWSELRFLHGVFIGNLAAKSSKRLSDRYFTAGVRVKL